MSIKHSLLALLRERPHYGYELRQDFDSRTGSTWPLNIGQIYTTLERLSRDGLVADAGSDADGRHLWKITDAGRAEAEAWLRSPVDRPTQARDELAMKLAIAATLPGVDIAGLIQTQRESTTRILQDLTRAKAAGRDPDTREELAWLLVVDSMIFAAEAELRWLDHSEQRFARVMKIETATATDTSPHEKSASEAKEAKR